ncbi:TPA: EpsG family protein [Photobacterium damselae]
MGFYLLLLTLILFFSLFSKYDEYNILLIISIFLLALFAGGRTIGSSPDDFNYFYSIYYHNFSFESFYGFIEKLNIFLFSGNIQTQFIIISFLSMFFLFLSLRKYRNIALWSLLIYTCHIFLYRDMIQIRAAVSYNLALLSFVIVNDWKGKGIIYRYFLVYIISIGFHVSSVISIISLILKKIKISFTQYVFYLFLSFVFSLLLSKFFLQTIGAFIPELSIYINTYILDDGGFTYKLGLLNPTTIKSFVFSIIFFKYRKEICDYFGSNLYLNLYSFSTLILIAFSNFAVFASRIASLFSVVEIVIVPVIIFSAKKNKITLFVFFVCVYLTILTLNLFYKGMLDNYGFSLL